MSPPCFLGLISPWALLLAAMLPGCGLDQAPPPDLPRPPPRVVSLSPIASDVLLSLGAADSLIPAVDLAASADLEPDLVVVPPLLDDDQEIAQRLRAKGVDVIEFAPHDFDDAYRLCRLLGLHLGRADEASRFVSDHSRELALLSAASFGYQRPRVAAVVGLAPLEIAGGHSFTTDLIEITGAESVTHGGDAFRVPMTPSELVAAAPDLVLVISATALSDAERSEARSLLDGVSPVAFMAFDQQHVWLYGAIDVARHLRELVRPLVRGPLPQTLPIGEARAATPPPR